MSVMDERDELAKGMDEWEIGCALKLQLEHGHSFGTAHLLAKYSRDMLEADLRRPLPLCVVTGF